MDVQKSYWQHIHLEPANVLCRCRLHHHLGCNLGRGAIRPGQYLVERTTDTLPSKLFILSRHMLQPTIVNPSYLLIQSGCKSCCAHQQRTCHASSLGSSQGLVIASLSAQLNHSNFTAPVCCCFGLRVGSLPYPLYARYKQLVTSARYSS